MAQRIHKVNHRCLSCCKNWEGMKIQSRDSLHLTTCKPLSNRACHWNCCILQCVVVKSSKGPCMKPDLQLACIDTFHCTAKKIRNEFWKLMSKPLSRLINCDHCHQNMNFHDLAVVWNVESSTSIQFLHLTPWTDIQCDQMTEFRVQ